MVLIAFLISTQEDMGMWKAYLQAFALLLLDALYWVLGGWMWGLQMEGISLPPYPGESPSQPNHGIIYSNP